MTPVKPMYKSGFLYMFGKNAFRKRFKKITSRIVEYFRLYDDDTFNIGLNNLHYNLFFVIGAKIGKNTDEGHLKRIKKTFFCHQA